MILSSLSPLLDHLSLSLSVVPHYRSFLLPRSIHVSLSRRLIPPHFSVAPRNLYVRFTIGVLRFCHCFIAESWLYNEASYRFLFSVRARPLFRDRL